MRRLFSPTRPHRWIVAGLLVVLMGSKLDRLSPDERAHWRALRVFVEERDQKRWLKLKTEEERDAWLKERGLWDRYYENDPATRELILAGDVQLGWDRYQLYMAWGQPSQKMRMTGRSAVRSERLVYRFEVDEEGFASPLVGTKVNHRAVDRYQMNVILDDDVITQILELDHWD